MTFLQNLKQSAHMKRIDIPYLIASLLVAILLLTSCGAIPQNQAILQDVANDSGVIVGTQAMALASPNARISTSAAKSQAFWGGGQ